MSTRCRNLTISHSYFRRCPLSFVTCARKTLGSTSKKQQLRYARTIHRSNMPTSDPAVQTNSLFDAMLLAAAGGLFDALTYLNHGRVFATAMTGNTIFLGIEAAHRNWNQIIPHLVPILGFLFGVLTSKHLRSRLGIHSLLVSLVFEIVTIFALGWFAYTFPPMAFTGIIAYVAAVQVASFRRVDRFAFN